MSNADNAKHQYKFHGDARLSTLFHGVSRAYKVLAEFLFDILLEPPRDSAILIMMTRWHVDDLLGRFLETEHNCRVLRFPAIAEEDEPPTVEGARPSSPS